MIPNDYRTWAEAVAGEVTDRLAAVATVRPVAYTAAQAEHLARQLTYPRTNGTFTGTSDPTELFRLAEAHGILLPLATVACRVPWCTGAANEHGGDGRTASDYDHTGEPDTLAPHDMLSGWFEQLADMPPFYRIESQPSPPAANTLLTAAEVRALADEFEQHAATLRERATQLEQYGGIQ